MRTGMGFLACVAALSFDAAHGAASNESPRRIVSINVCADQLVLTLAPREAIVSLSFLSRSVSHSALHASVGNIPQNRGSAEEVLALSPDIVIAGRYTTRATVAMLRKLGIAVHELDLPNTIAHTRAQIRTLAAAIGRRARGEEVIAELDRRLRASLPRRTNVRPNAVLYRANAFTAGANTLAGAVLTHTGFANAATNAGIEGFGHLPLERLLWQRPNVIIFDNDREAGPSIASQSLSHPVFERLARSAAIAHVPGRLWSCAGPWLAQAAERLARLRAELTPGAPRQR